MKSREQIAIEALPRYEQRGAILGPDSSGDYLLRADVLAALAPPAQGGIDPDDATAWVTPLRYGSKVTFPKPPKPDGWDDDEEEWYCRPLFRQEQVDAIILADRAARQSAAPGERATTQASCAVDALDGLGYKYDAELGWLPPPALSEPVPQGVPDGWQLVPIKLTKEMHGAAVRELRGCTGNGDFPPRIHAAMLAAAPTAPTATSGGEALATYGRCTLQEHCRCRDYESDVREICANWQSRIAPPPLPATDAASVLEVLTDEALEIFFNERGFYPNNLGDTTRFFEAIRALISKEGI